MLSTMSGPLTLVIFLKVTRAPAGVSTKATISKTSRQWWSMISLGNCLPPKHPTYHNARRLWGVTVFPMSCLLQGSSVPLTRTSSPISRASPSLKLSRLRPSRALSRPRQETPCKFFVDSVHNFSCIWVQLFVYICTNEGYKDWFNSKVYNTIQVNLSAGPRNKKVRAAQVLY